MLQGPALPPATHTAGGTWLSLVFVFLISNVQLLVPNQSSPRGRVKKVLVKIQKHFVFLRISNPSTCKRCSWLGAFRSGSSTCAAAFSCRQTPFLFHSPPSSPLRSLDKPPLHFCPPHFSPAHPSCPSLFLRRALFLSSYFRKLKMSCVFTPLLPSPPGLGEDSSTSPP